MSPDNPHSDDENLTTQAAANMLGVSRTYLVRLLEQEKIPCTSAGSHRRIKVGDLLAYMQKRERARHEALNRLTREVEAAGLYDKNTMSPDTPDTPEPVPSLGVPSKPK
jgi:excisionase family DNA binding protein